VQDNMAVCSVITREVQLSNNWNIQPYQGDAAGMWKALQDA
jgi:hypothetical protein